MKSLLIPHIVRLVNALYAYNGIELVGPLMQPGRCTDVYTDWSYCRRSGESATECTQRSVLYDLSMRGD